MPEQAMQYEALKAVISSTLQAETYRYCVESKKFEAKETKTNPIKDSAKEKTHTNSNNQKVGNQTHQGYHFKKKQQQNKDSV